VQVRLEIKKRRYVHINSIEKKTATDIFTFIFRLLNTSDSQRLVNSSLDSTRETSSEPIQSHQPSPHLVHSASVPDTRQSLMSAEAQSNVVQPLLTDLYQISMAYAYWKSKKHQEKSVFDLYFRKNRNTHF